MKQPIDAYREGFEKGRADNIAGNVSETIFGMMRDDPWGHFATGYRDAAGNKNFNPPKPDAQRPHANDEVNPFDDKIAIRAQCAQCGAIDWFEWKLMGKLTDPMCGHTWYVDSGTYTVQQIRAVFQAGAKMAKYMTKDVSGEGAWIAKLLGGFCGVVFGIAFRLPFAAIMIPIQAGVRIFQAKQQPSSKAGEAPM